MLSLGMLVFVIAVFAGTVWWACKDERV